MSLWPHCPVPSTHASLPVWRYTGSCRAQRGKCRNFRGKRSKWKVMSWRFRFSLTEQEVSLTEVWSCVKRCFCKMGRWEDPTYLFGLVSERNSAVDLPPAIAPSHASHHKPSCLFRAVVRVPNCGAEQHFALLQVHTLSPCHPRPVRVHRPGGLLAHPQPCGEEHAQGGGGGGDRDGEGAPRAGPQRDQEGTHRHQGQCFSKVTCCEISRKLGIDQCSRKHFAPLKCERAKGRMSSNANRGLTLCRNVSSPSRDTRKAWGLM